MSEPEPFGIENGKVVIDSYSGEAMDPTFAHIWRAYCAARSDLEDVHRQLGALGVSWGVITPSMVDDDAPFTWRDLTEDEQAWCEQAYADRNPWERSGS